MSLILIGIIVGFFSGFLGVGGGTILIPILLILGFNFKVAVGISVMQMMMSSLYGSFLNYKKGLLKINNGLSLAIGGAFGGSLSGIVVKYSSEKLLGALFLILILIAILRFIFSLEDGEEKEINPIIMFFIGLFVGVIAISVGVGGAVLITPILVGFFKYSLKKSVSLSLFFVVFSSISGFVSQSIVGNIDYYDGLIIGVSSLIGTYIGVKLYHYIDSKYHKKILLVWYLIVFVIMIDKLYLTN